ncbi:RbsD/FucU domain-containing protein [Novosphingobium sp. ERW19]|jgi:L-fucose mutarotase|uniref:RbsD/FucU family protein n=1 Tax=Novosphingobium sp. ERW19 TaxID=2726186 RepID=UPI0014565D0B|nr:RbsD/FucU domain-containing protein [Novosphingobium sp. ERW19]NLR41288.1 ribose ABC transporter [Novosphingobium sp. ERW19]
MLKNIDPLLGPDLLHSLCAMGHGDAIAIVDANFPAEANARRLHRAEGIGATRMAEAILSVMPVDDFALPSAYCMAVEGDESEPSAMARAFARLLAVSGHGHEIGLLDRDDFYDRARRCFAIVATGEMLLYGNLILVKGVIG